MGELRNAAAVRWDLDRMFRVEGLGCPFSDGVTFADVDFEIERRGRFLVLEGKREGQYLSVGQARTMKARLDDGRTCLVFWGDPEAGAVSAIGYYCEHFPGSRDMQLHKVAATNRTLWRVCSEWWNWASGLAYPSPTRSPFVVAPSLIEAPDPMPASDFDSPDFESAWLR